MNYQEILQVIKSANPDMPQKEAQKKASEKHKIFKAAAKALAAESIPVDAVVAKPVATTKTEGTIARETLLAVENRIRAAGVDKNRICLLGHEIIPLGQMVKHGMNGINTNVTFEDEAGNRIPVDGYFVVWL